MKALIETYRGWEIYFDTDKEEFYALSNEFDKDERKRSYASVKTYIDNYIKENNQFKPILVQRMPSMFNSGDVIKLIGIRKDNAFMYEDKDGRKQQLSTYSEKDYFLVDPQNDRFFKRIEELRAERDKIDSEMSEIEKMVVKVDVRQIKKNLLGDNTEA